MLWFAFWRSRDVSSRKLLFEMVLVRVTVHVCCSRLVSSRKLLFETGMFHGMFLVGNYYSRWLRDEPGLSSAVHLFVWFVMNFISSRIRSSGLSWTSYHHASVRLVCHELHIVMNFTSIHLVCHGRHIRSSGLSWTSHLFVYSSGLSWTSYLFVWFVMNFASSCIYSPGLSWASHPFVWFVMDFISIRLVCRPPCIRSSGLSSAARPLVWFVMNFTSSCIHSSGLSWTSRRRTSVHLARHDLRIAVFPLCCCSWFSHPFIRRTSIHLVCRPSRIHSHRRASIRLVCRDFHIRCVSIHLFTVVARWLVGLLWAWFSFVTRLLFVSRVDRVGSHFVCGFRVCPVCWVCDHECGRVLLSHREVHFVVSRRESHSFVSVRAQWCASRRESRE